MITQGEWFAGVAVSSSGFTRAIYARREDGPDIFVAYVGNWKQEPKIEVNDAALIVAAPTMLQALQIAEEQYENFAGAGKDDGTLGVIRAAIAKAKGIKS